jgi:hypothetical protein
MNSYNQRERQMYLRNVFIKSNLKVKRLNQPPRLKNNIANKPLAIDNTPQRFNFSFQIKKASRVVSRIIPTFINGKTNIAGKNDNAARRKIVLKTLGTPSINPDKAACLFGLIFLVMIYNEE